MKRLKTLFIVDEECITCRNKSESFIKWSDVVLVEVKFISRPTSFRQSFVIKIHSLNNAMEIGSEINNARELITFMKNKLGAKFDTKEIPVEFKYKQR